MSERQFDNFDEHAESYRNVHDKSIKISGADSHYFSEQKILELVDFEETNHTLKILDFGCGEGNSSIFIRKYFPKATIYGIDISEKSIEEANKKNISNSTFSSFDGKIITFKDEEFDIVFTSMVFHHIEFKFHKEILKEINRILKKGGRFYNFEHNPKNPLTRKVVRACKFDKNAVLLKPIYNYNIIKECGFRKLELKYILFIPRYKYFKILLRLENLLTWCPIGAQYFIRAIK